MSRIWRNIKTALSQGGWLIAVIATLGVGILVAQLEPGQPADVADDVADAVVPGGGPVPPELTAEEARGPDMPRGPQVGATPNKSYPRPDSYLTDRGYRYSFVASPNWTSRFVHPPEAVVMHVFGSGTCEGLKSWFRNPSAQVSAHFGVCKNGEIVQFVEVGDSAWHAGYMNRPRLDQPRIAYWNDHGINPNLRTVGIEVDLKPGERISDYPAMDSAVNDLLIWVLETLRLEPHRGNILAHAEIDSVNRAVDPWCCIDINQTAEYVAFRMSPQQPAPLPVQLTLENLAERVRRIEEQLGIQVD